MEVTHSGPVRWSMLFTCFVDVILVNADPPSLANHYCGSELFCLRFALLVYQMHVSTSMTHSFCWANFESSILLVRSNSSRTLALLRWYGTAKTAAWSASRQGTSVLASDRLASVSVITVPYWSSVWRAARSTRPKSGKRWSAWHAAHGSRYQVNGERKRPCATSKVPRCSTWHIAHGSRPRVRRRGKRLSPGSALA